MYLTIIYRTIFLYFYIVLCYRLMGKKEIGQLGIIDLIVSFSIAELASISIEATDKSIFTSIIPISILVLLEIILSYIGLKSDSFRKCVDGNPELVINNGKLDFKLMKRLRYTIDDLLTHLRKKDIDSISKVKYAVLETDGTLSVLDNYPMPLILDGKIDKNTLTNLKKDYEWLENVLKENNIKLEDVFYAFYSNDKTYIIRKD